MIRKATWVLRGVDYLKEVAIVQHFFVRSNMVPNFFSMYYNAYGRPRQVVIRATSSVEVAFLNRELVLVVYASIFGLYYYGVRGALSYTIQGRVCRAGRVLAKVARSRTSSSAKFRMKDEATRVGYSRALVLVPSVCRAVRFFLKEKCHGIEGRFVPMFFRFDRYYF